MQVIKVTAARQLKKFISMTDALYRSDPLYVPQMQRDLFCVLKKAVIKEGKCTALMAIEDGRVVARVLLSEAPSKQKGLDRCGYFSHFECVDDAAVAEALLSAAEEELRARGITYLEGPYFPLDPDNRRGILIDGFDTPPMILTSHNPKYYGALLEKCGYAKDADTVEYEMDYSRYDFDRVERLASRILDRYGLYVADADFSRLNREIDDVHKVIEAATNDAVFQAAPTREDIEKIVAGWKNFLWPDMIHICRRRSDDAPVGMMISVPDFNKVFAAMKGRTNPAALLRGLKAKKHIDAVRSILQYVIPEYQGKGVNFVLYHAFCFACKKRGITRIEAGTIMENNVSSRLSVENAGGKVAKIYRIFGKQL